MEEKKAIEFRELPDNKVRLFRDRSEIVIETPQGVKDNTNIAPESIPESISITPMTHREAELRERLKSALQSANRRVNFEAGITREEIAEYETDIKKVYDDTLAVLEDESIPEEERLIKAEKVKVDVLDKHKDFLYKSECRNLAPIHDAEDALRENTVSVVCSNCKSITVKGESIKITPDTLDSIHPDLIWWIVFEIESHSYLTTGEIAGFR